MPKLVKKVRPQPQQNIVELLSDYLKRAKRGEVRAIFLTAILHDDDGETSDVEIACGKWVWRDALLGAVERGKAMAMRTWWPDVT